MPPVVSIPLLTIIGAKIIFPSVAFQVVKYSVTDGTHSVEWPLQQFNAIVFRELVYFLILFLKNCF